MKCRKLWVLEGEQVRSDDRNEDNIEARLSLPFAQLARCGVAATRVNKEDKGRKVMYCGIKKKAQIQSWSGQGVYNVEVVPHVCRNEFDFSRFP
jgi:hypothetical protein